MLIDDLLSTGEVLKAVDAAKTKVQMYWGMWHFQLSIGKLDDNLRHIIYHMLHWQIIELIEAAEEMTTLKKNKNLACMEKRSWKLVKIIIEFANKDYIFIF